MINILVFKRIVYLSKLTVLEGHPGQAIQRTGGVKGVECLLACGAVCRSKEMLKYIGAWLEKLLACVVFSVWGQK